MSLWIAVRSSARWRVRRGLIVENPVEWSCPCGRNVYTLFRGVTRRGHSPECFNCKRWAPLDAAPKRIFAKIVGDNLGVTKQEVKELYSPGPKAPLTKEKA